MADEPVSTEESYDPPAVTPLGAIDKVTGADDFSANDT